MKPTNIQVFIGGEKLPLDITDVTIPDKETSITALISIPPPLMLPAGGCQFVFTGTIAIRTNEVLIVKQLSNSSN